MSKVETEQKTQIVTYSAYQSDVDMLQGIQEFLGCSKSEAIRTCIRIASTHLPMKRKKYSYDGFES